MKVKNPTNQGKAVRVAGGLTTIPPGGELEVNEEWEDFEIARYKAAGLVISKTKAAPKPAPAPANKDS